KRVVISSGRTSALAKIASPSTTLMESGTCRLTNVVITASQPQPVLSIRGIATTPTNSSFDQSVATFIDGFYAGRPKLSLVPFFDVNRVEVLRGPQSTFFGNSAVGGALSVITNTPEVEGGYLNISAGTQSEYSAELANTFSLGKTLRVRAAGKYRTFGGFLEESLTGEMIGEEQQINGRISALFTPSDKVSLTLKAEYAEVTGNGMGLQQNGPPTENAESILDGILTGAPFAVEDPAYPQFTSVVNDFRTNAGGTQALSSNTFIRAGGFAVPSTAFGANLWHENPYFHNLGRRDITNNIYQLTGEFELFNAGYKFISQSSYGSYDSYDFIDLDASAYALATVEFLENYSQASQEFRLLSPENKPFRWLAGAYYQRSEVDDQTNIVYVLAPTGGVLFTERSWWTSGFISAEYDISDRLTLGAGMRLSIVTKDGRSNPLYALSSVDGSPLVNPLPSAINPFPLPVASQAIGLGALPAEWVRNPDIRVLRTTYETNNLDYSASLNYEIQNANLYFRYVNGFKAGGINAQNVSDPTVTPQDQQFNDEKVDAFELGIKGVTINDVASYELSTFYNIFSDLQTSQLNQENQLPVVTNAGKAISAGAELEGRFKVSERFKLGLQVAYLDAHYTEWKTTPNAEEIADGRSSDGTSIDRGALGYRLKYAPEWTLSLNPQLLLPVGYTKQLEVDLFYSYRTEYVTGDNYFAADTQDAYGLLDATVSITDKVTQKWRLSLYGRNLGNTHYAVYSNNQLLIPGRSRRVGLQLLYRW
ncbi:MAG: TonB-dependent receptor plug domain-containing protein, partial [Bacteroidota bacterium]